ncbi:polysaccharide pyruvyl transferase CsaB [Vallitalea okinawensis]|uniref:polysaccharide pyruvyl transferase CsaB n=1 Tax=Vallitalea okinawensis TaxID=2078660 RepID=UPI00130022FC|nr:polysaccharide pyruvyl transferase CsaB [Vallitalea okinawensis]
MINILISGYLGFRNSGDESILYAIQKNIKENRSDVHITALSKRPEETIQNYKINAIPAFNPFKVIKEIHRSDILLSGGGTLLQDGTSTRSLLYYLSVITLGKMMRKKVMLYANGIGPLTNRINRRLVKWVANGVEVITLREEISFKELTQLGVSKPRIEVAADPVFTLDGVSKEEAARILRDDDISTDQPFVVVSFREWKDCKGLYKKMADICDTLIKKYQYNILFIPMQRPSDIHVANRIKEMMRHQQRAFVLKRKYTPDEIIGMIGLAQLVMSMRLHTLLYAGIKNVPMIGFVYDPKVQYYLDILKMPTAGDIRSIDVEYVMKQVDDLNKKYETKVEELSNISRELYVLADKNDKHLTDLIEQVKAGRKYNG